MGLLGLDRRIDAEVLDARGALAVTTGGNVIIGTLKDTPQLFVEGAQLAIALQVGGARYDAVCRVINQAVVVTPGSRIQLEVLRARPADISGIEPFDLVPRTPPQGVPPPVGPATLEDESPEDDEPTGVVGTLKEMPVCEIVQTLWQGARDAIIEVRPKGSESGTIGVVKGRVVFAKSDTRVGEEAFYELFSASRGAFRIRYGRKPDEVNIARDPTFLLLEGARLMDERMSGKQFVPASASAFEPSLTLPDSAIVPLPPLPPPPTPMLVSAKPTIKPAMQPASKSSSSKSAHPSAVARMPLAATTLPPILEPEEAGVTLIDTIVDAAMAMGLDDGPTMPVLPLVHAKPPPLPPSSKSKKGDTSKNVLAKDRANDERTDSKKNRKPKSKPTPEETDPTSRPGSESGPFSAFFDEAGVDTPEPLPLATQRFHSLALSDLHEMPDADEDDNLDSNRTTRERKNPLKG